MAAAAPMDSPTADQQSEQLINQDGEAPTTPPDWDISRGKWTEGFCGRIGMVLPMIFHTVGSLLGGVFAGAGYAVATLGRCCTGTKAVDSCVFHAGCSSFLRLNGLCYDIQHLPLGEAVPQLKALYGDEATENLRAQDPLAPIIVSNHTSYLDGLVLCSVFGHPKIVAKEGSRRTPLFGRIMEEMEVIFVNNKDKDSRQKTAKAITDHAENWVPGSRPLLIFPEGTTSNGEGLLEFKKGAFTSGRPVRPVVIAWTGAYDVACTSYRSTEQGLVEFTDKGWLCQVLGHFRLKLHARVLPPYVPNAAEQADPEVFAQNVRALMLTELQTLKEELAKSAGRCGCCV